MKRFYAHLDEKKSIANALTAAKRDMLETFGREAIPYHWAGFTLEGLGDQPIRIREEHKLAYATHTSRPQQDTQ